MPSDVQKRCLPLGRLLVRVMDRQILQFWVGPAASYFSSECVTRHEERLGGDCWLRIATVPQYRRFTGPHG
jgi:hypothetical protein